MSDYKNFKLVIKAKKTPIVNNPLIEYIKGENEHLYCDIYYNETLISKGVILDFYKEFENKTFLIFNEYTDISTFEWRGKRYTKNTYFGQKIFEIKNFINPPLDKKKRGAYLNEIVNYFNPYIKNLIKRNIVPTISYVPSSLRIPNDIAHKLAALNNLKIVHIIKKNSNLQSKTLTTINSQSFNKYIVNFQGIDKSNTFLIIDDVVGTGATFCEIMYKFYKFNQKINFFLAVVKDVKR